MKRTILTIALIAVVLVAARNHIAQVDRVERVKNGAMIIGHVPCQTVAFTTVRKYKDAVRVMVYYKNVPGNLVGCAWGGVPYRLAVHLAGWGQRVVTVNGMLISH